MSGVADEDLIQISLIAADSVCRRRPDVALVRVMTPLGNSPADAEKSAIELASETARVSHHLFRTNVSETRP